ncbi:DNA-3-methyladenine glycosylase family protein [Streptomyces sp. NPDC093675]|uniref:DNA-3-methyladenine glycosylase family protein n=1 Tax=Streptomyces sp. NPDC093675 TaxID=3366049 RepID=UPI00381EFEE5
MTATPSRTARAGARQAATLLAQRDPVIAHLARVAGPPRFPRPTEAHFEALVRAITQQQLAAPAAATIHRRLVQAVSGDVTPQGVLTVPEQALRDAGLSAAKAASVRDLASKALDGTLTLEPRRLARQSDEDVIAHLTTVRGIGTWSAQMFLISQLRRPDVWPTGDLAMRKGFAHAWNIDLPTPKQLDALGDAYRPYRSVLAWYCWQAARLQPDMTATLPWDRVREGSA